MRTFLSLAVLFCAVSFGMVIKGTLNADDWEFMTKFAIDNVQEGSVEYFGDKDIPGLLLVVYTDLDWAKLRANESHMTCEQRVAAQTGSFPLTQHSKFTLMSRKRPYFWFMAVAKCGAKFDLKYNATLLNPGGFWNRQFSFDVQGLPEAYLVFFLLLLGYFFVNTYLCWRVTRGGVRLHTALRMLTVAIILELMSVTCTLLHYLAYAGDGVGLGALKFFGLALSVSSQLTLLVLIMLLAKGWTITSTTLPLYDRKLIAGSFVSFTVAYIILLFWQTFGEDKASTTYYYNTLPGLLVCALRTGLLVWFVFTLRFTYKKEPDWDKLKFYFTFGVLYTVWLMALPVLVMISFAIEPWYRFKIVDGLVVSFHFVGLCFMGFLLHPTKAQSVFSMTLPSVTYGEFSPYDTVL